MVLPQIISTHNSYCGENSLVGPNTCLVAVQSLMSDPRGVVGFFYYLNNSSWISRKIIVNATGVRNDRIGPHPSPFPIKMSPSFASHLPGSALGPHGLWAPTYRTIWKSGLLRLFPFNSIVKATWVVIKDGLEYNTTVGRTFYFQSWAFVLLYLKIYSQSFYSSPTKKRKKFYLYSIFLILIFFYLRILLISMKNFNFFLD